jgi:uncharacterized protein (TIGR02301 family)
MRTVSLLVVFALAIATPALGQQREPVQRQTLVDLAYVLGEAHSLRQLCAGPSDQFWRNRMLKMIETESADHAFEQRLRETFNTGYVARQAQFTHCSAQSRDAETRVAAHGQALAQRLIVEPTAPAQPDSLAPQ